MPVVLNLRVTSAIVAWRTPPEFPLPIDSGTGSCSICCPIDAIVCRHFVFRLPIGSDFGREDWHVDRITPTQCGHSADKSAGCNRKSQAARFPRAGGETSIERFRTFPLATWRDPCVVNPFPDETTV
ncbi:hypothetical protein RISK_000370 [Rhodopirellula islandica]|uniref:Uncharacterized protein n=1 Tax=Rhodopirellula islandica TaxID=595434 RepID=A0A0J1BLA7_RHOIS|nr:hypothetical protein RISK_000370 [Rhodopirellula islandica]